MSSRQQVAPTDQHPGCQSRELADSIAATQRTEIKELDWLIQDIEERPGHDAGRG